MNDNVLRSAVLKSQLIRYIKKTLAYEGLVTLFNPQAQCEGLTVLSVFLSETTASYTMSAAGF